MMVSGNPAEKILSCPFCSLPVGETREIMTRFGNTFTGGRCECGAVYVYDQSGHNMGDAYVDALTYACGGDWDLAWSLTPEVDYDVVEKTHDVRRSKYMIKMNPRGRTPSYIFVKIKGDAVRKDVQ